MKSYESETDVIKSIFLPCLASTTKRTHGDKVQGNTVFIKASTLTCLYTVSNTDEWTGHHHLKV